VAGWIAFLVAGSIFLTLAWDVAAREPIVDIDVAVTSWFEDHRSEGLTEFLLAVTQVHALAAIGLWSVAFALVLARMREWYWMLTLGLAVGGGMLLNVALKVAFERARPQMDDPLVLLDTYSFPSGHTAASTVFYGVLAAFLVSRYRDPRRRVAFVAFAVSMVALVAVSRVYLGAHYMSDVLAAMCASIVWLVLVLSSVHGIVRERMARGAA
jgi:undecaprenyl-diphosphatase